MSFSIQEKHVDMMTLDVCKGKVSEFIHIQHKYLITLSLKNN